MASQSWGARIPRGGDPAAGALEALSRLEAPSLDLSSLARHVHSVLRRCQVSLGVVLARLPSPGSASVRAIEPHADLSDVEVLVHEPLLPGAVLARLLRAMARPAADEVDLVVAPFRFRLFPLGTQPGGRPVVVAIQPGPELRRAAGAALNLALSLLRLKVASQLPVAVSDAALPALLSALRVPEPSQDARELARSIVSHVARLVSCDAAGLLLQERGHIRVTLLPSSRATSAIVDDLAAALVEQQDTLAGTPADPAPAPGSGDGPELERLGPASTPAGPDGEAPQPDSRGEVRGSRLCLPLIRRDGSIAGHIGVASLDPGRYVDAELILLSGVAGYLGSVMDNRHQFLELEREAQLDEMTELYNYRAFRKLLAGELSRAVRYGKPLSVLMLDLDHFKQVNDTWGHQTGDAVLRDVARVLARAKRREDVVARYGGEEFTVILPETSLEGARLVAERLRATIERARILRDRPITVSIGVASRSGRRRRTGEELVARADSALYRAKRRGRNRVEVARG
jgi:diguanylate cyclase (GGDEF)-like protein